MRLLLVDDFQEIRELICSFLESEFSCEVVTASGGQQAIEILNKDTRFDLVLSDLNMPRIGGKDIYFHLRKSLQLPIPFILFSGETQTDFGRTESDPHIGFIAKPFDEEALANLVRSLMGPGANQSAGPIYFPVSIELIKKVEFVSSPLFLKLKDDHFIKVLSEGTIFGESEYSKYQTKNIHELFVEKGQASFFFETYLEKIFSLDELESMSTSEAAEAIKFHSEMVREAVKQFGISPETVQLVKSSIDAVMLAVRNERDFGLFLRRMRSSTERAFGTHTLTMSLVCVELAKKLNITNPKTLYHLVMASLFHDTTLSDHQIVNKTALVAATLFTDFKGSSDLMEISSHSGEAADILKKWPDCPPEVIDLVLTHHERIDGKGFPQKLSGDKMTELTALFSFVEDMVHFFMESPEGLYDFEPYIQSQVSRYASPQFTKITAAFNELLGQKKSQP